MMLLNQKRQNKLKFIRLKLNKKKKKNFQDMKGKNLKKKLLKKLKNSLKDIMMQLQNKKEKRLQQKKFY